ncbi:hypothetical protein evm_006732 [Chilo suppressalis]|nr:hypothetical protein evm_006732 [Chilo suppressalis]
MDTSPEVAAQAVAVIQAGHSQRNHKFHNTMKTLDLSYLSNPAQSMPYVEVCVCMGVISKLKLYRCAEYVQYAIGNLYSVQVFETITVLVMCLVRLVINERDVLFLLAVLTYICCLFALTYAYFSAAGDVTYHASTVSTSMFHCGWEFVAGSKSLRSMAVVAIQRSQVPVYMTAFGVVLLSYSNFISPINNPTAGEQAFPMDGIGRLGHEPPRGRSADCRELTTADAAGTKGLTCLPKHNTELEANSKDKLNTVQLGYGCEKTAVYVSEHLCPYYKGLHAETRKIAREKGYKYVWIRNGRIFIRKNDESPAGQVKAGYVSSITGIGPYLVEWMTRRHGSLSFRLVQVMTAHGAFGHYLHRIGREPDTRCHQCGAGDDTAQHALEACAAFDAERRQLVTVVGRDLSLPTLVRAMVDSATSWEAVASCEQIMLQREAAERAREEDPSADPIRKRRVGRRRRQYAALQPPSRGGGY